MSIKSFSEIDAYCVAKSTSLSPTAMAIYQTTIESRFNERLLIDPVGAQFLGFISNIFKPQAILEIGTFSGFTAQVLAEGLTPDGLLTSIEINEDHFLFAKECLQSSDRRAQIEFILGDALTEIPKLNRQYDLIFLDAAKRQYTKHYELALQKLKTGGILLADNALWKNRVLLEEPDNMTKGVQKFNDYVQADDRVTNSLIPVGDGIHMIMKK